MPQSGWKQPRQGENRQGNAGSHEGQQATGIQAYKGDSEPRNMAEKSEKARNATMRNQQGEHKQGSWYKKLGDRERGREKTSGEQGTLRGREESSKPRRAGESNTHQRDRRRCQEEKLSSPACFVSEKQQTVLE